MYALDHAQPADRRGRCRQPPLLGTKIAAAEEGETLRLTGQNFQSAQHVRHDRRHRSATITALQDDQIDVVVPTGAVRDRPPFASGRSERDADRDPRPSRRCRAAASARTSSAFSCSPRSPACQPWPARASISVPVAAGRASRRRSAACCSAIMWCPACRRSRAIRRRTTFSSSCRSRRTIRFRPATYLMRVRIDGAESRLASRPNPAARHTCNMSDQPSRCHERDRSHYRARPLEARQPRASRGRNSRGCACCCIAARCGCAGTGRTIPRRTTWPGASARRRPTGCCAARTALAKRAFYADRCRTRWRLASSLASIEARIDAIGRELRQAGVPAALDVLAHLFGLSRFERDVFLLALAPELEFVLRAPLRLCAGRFDPPPCDAAARADAAAGQPSDEQTVDARDCFLPDATLRRFRLLAHRRRRLRRRHFPTGRCASTSACSTSCSASTAWTSGSPRILDPVPATADLVRRSGARRAHRALGAIGRRPLDHRAPST